jgi:hypothetical protein
MTFPLLPEAGPALIENIVEGDYVRLTADDYMEVLDHLYPKGPSTYNDSASCQLFVIAYSIMYSTVHPVIWDLYLLPLLAQQNIHYRDHDQRPMLETTIRRQSYRISANIISLWGFFGLTLFVVISCAIVSYSAGFGPIPDTSRFPEFDIASKLERTGTDGDAGIITFADVSALMMTKKTLDLPELIGDFIVVAQKKHKKQWIAPENRVAGAIPLEENALEV